MTTTPAKMTQWFHWKPFLAGALFGLLIAVIGVMFLSTVGRTLIFASVIYLLGVFITRQAKTTPGGKAA